MQDTVGYSRAHIPVSVLRFELGGVSIAENRYLHGITYGVQDDHNRGDDAHSCCGAHVSRGGVAESITYVLVKILVSTVNLTMLTRAWPLKFPSLLLSLNSYPKHHRTVWENPQRKTLT